MQRDIQLSANERVALRPITLEVGELNETISVTAEAARVQTLSGERSGTITQDPDRLIARSRAATTWACKLLPGVVDTQNREAPGWNNLGGISINGGRNNTVNLTYDGVTNLDTGSNTGPFWRLASTRSPRSRCSRPTTRRSMGAARAARSTS